MSDSRKTDLSEAQVQILERLFSIDAEQQCMLREIKRTKEEIKANNDSSVLRAISIFFSIGI